MMKGLATLALDGGMMVVVRGEDESGRMEIVIATPMQHGFVSTTARLVFHEAETLHQVLRDFVEMRGPADVDDGDYIAERVAERDNIPPSPFDG